MNDFKRETPVVTKKKKITKKKGIRSDCCFPA